MEKATEVERHGSLLHIPASTWERDFIKDGKLDKEALVKAGYDGEGQTEYIEQEMIKLGWIDGGGDAPAATGTKKKK